jgi:hypothetical protein
VEVATLAAATEASEGDVLDALREAGATSVAVQEVALRELLATGRVHVRASDGARSPQPDVVYLSPGPWPEQIALNLTTKFPGTRRLQRRGGPVPLFPDIVESLGVGVGYDQDAVSAVKAAGLLRIARPLVDEVRTTEAVDLVCRQARETGATKVVWTGQSVLGYRGLVAHTANALRANGLTHCTVEFGKQLGDTGLCSRLESRVVRLHSINENEMATMAAGKAIERFVRAVRERNIRVCYVRLFLDATGDPLAANADFVRRLADALERAGYELGAAQPLGDIAPAAQVRPAVALSAVAGALLLLVALWELPSVLVWALLAAGVLGCAAGPPALGEQWYKLMALLAAVVFPTLGVSLTRLGEGTGATGFGACWRRGLWRFGVAAGCSLAGALTVAALLSEARYLVKTDQFTGVKLAQFAPLGLLALILLGRPFGRAPERRETPRDYLPGWRHALAQTVEYGHVALLFAALVVLAMLLVRSGNEPAMGVTGLELKVRSALEDALVVRPRTKEFLIAHPLLLLALALNARGCRRGLWLMVLLGAVGQCSMVNTFCHLHTPLEVSLLRTVHGLWIGVLVGTALTWVVFRALAQRARAEQAAPAP